MVTTAGTPSTPRTGQVPPPGNRERLPTVPEAESHENDGHGKDRRRGSQCQVGQSFRPQGCTGQAREEVVDAPRQSPRTSHPRSRAIAAIGRKPSGRDREQCGEAHRGHRCQPEQRPDAEEGSGREKVAGGGAVRPRPGRQETPQPAGWVEVGLTCAAAASRSLPPVRSQLATCRSIRREHRGSFERGKGTGLPARTG